MIVDPINWESFRSRLRAMSRGWNSGGATDAIFRERVSLRHAPCKRQPPEEILRVLGTRSLYSFFDAYSPSLPMRMKRPNLPQRFSTLLDKCNYLPRFLC